MVVTTCTRWSSSYSASYLDVQSCPIKKRTWNHIVCCCAFTGPDDYGGVRRGDIPVGASGLGIAKMCPWRRA